MRIKAYLLPNSFCFILAFFLYWIMASEKLFKIFSSASNIELLHYQMHIMILLVILSVVLSLIFNFSKLFLFVIHSYLITVISYAISFFHFFSLDYHFGSTTDMIVMFIVIPVVTSFTWVIPLLAYFFSYLFEAFQGSK